jgi:transposase
MSRTDPDVTNLVVHLARTGHSHRWIARELGVSRNTVRGVLERTQRQRTEGHSAVSVRATRPSKLDEFQPAIDELLANYPDITAVRLHEELVTRGFDGAYTIVKQRLRELRPRPKRQPVERFETEPGEQGQQDWSPYTLRFEDDGLQEVSAFGLQLGFCRREYLRFCEREDFYTLIREHKAAFEYFSGVPREILYDGQKAVVLRWEAERPLYNPRFLAFATHYGFRPRAVRRPEDKGKKERHFLYVERNLLNARTFRNLAHLNEVTARWRSEYADVRVHGTTRERPIDRFVIEAPRLLPLPAMPFDDAEVGYRVVSVEGRVAWNGTPYSVPCEHVLEVVVVRATATQILIYGAQFQEIARHPRAPRGCREPVIDPSHAWSRRERRHDVDRLSGLLTELGEAGASFAAGVVRTQRYRGAQLAHVLRLREKYDADDLLRALERASRYRAFDSKVVERILAATATPRPLPDSTTSALERLREAVPKTTPRPLSDYEDAIRRDADGGDDGDP